MSKKTLSIGMLAVLAAGITGGAAAAPVTLTIESWRNDDLAIWRDKIIPAFEKQHPDIKVRFAPTAPTEYNAALNSKLDAGTAAIWSLAVRSMRRSSCSRRVASLR